MSLREEEALCKLESKLAVEKSWTFKMIIMKNVLACK